MTPLMDATEGLTLRKLLQTSSTKVSAKRSGRARDIMQNGGK